MTLSFALGRRPDGTLIVAALNGEDLGLILRITGYGNASQSTEVKWVDSSILSGPAIAYILARINEQAFQIDGEAVALREGCFAVAERIGSLPDLSDVDIDLSGFRRPRGPDAPNS
jgi:hypothetical protein